MANELTVALPGLSTFQQFTAGNFNVSNAASNFQNFLVNRSILAPIGVKQIGPFAFDYQGDDSVEMDNDVTDHYLEDNTAVQDHIGVKPTMISMRGYVSELALAQSVANSISAALASVENTLSQADAYLGHYTPGVTQKMLTAITQAQSVAIQIEQAAARVAQIASFFTPGPQYDKQQTAFATLSSLRLAGVVFTVFTPFQVFDNMVIVSLVATQPERTRTMSDFVVKMKQLRFTDNISQSAFQSVLGGNAANNYQPKVSGGSTTGVPVPFNAVSEGF